MPTAEYRCHACGAHFEWVFAVSDWPFPDPVGCPRCTQPCSRYFSRPPAMSPDPHWNGYYDQQLGRYISSRDEKRRLLREKGLEEVSVEEHRRGFETLTEKTDVIPENDPKLREAMEKAYADTVAGNIPPVTPRKIEMGAGDVLS